MANQEIKTSIDALVVYLNEHGETNVTAVANALGVSENVILGWSNVLEKANVIRILHKAGKVFLAPVQGKTEAFQKETKQAEQQHMEMEVASQIEVINQVSAKMDEFTKSLDRIEELFNTKYKGAKSVLDRLNKTEKYLDEVEKSMGARSARIKDIAEKAQKGYESAQAYMTQLSSFNIDTNNASAVAQELHTLLNTYEKNAIDMSKNLETVMAQYRKSSNEIYKNVREKHDELKQVLSYEDTQIREFARLATDYKRKSGASVRHNEEASRRMLDQIQKSISTIDKLSSAAKQQVDGMRANIDDIKGSLGDVASLNQNIVNIKKDLAEVAGMRDTLLVDLRKLQQDMKAAKSKGEDVDELKNQANAATNAMASMQSKMDQVDSDMKNLGKGK